MSKPDSRLLFLILILGLLTVFWGCGQTDDITASKSLTNIWLSAERLPSLPPGMVYEMWVAEKPVTDTAIPTDELISIGRFSHITNDTINAFLDVNGVVRADSNKFVLSADLFDYSGIFVTVEDAGTAPGLVPGPIMLVEPVLGRPLDSVMRLNFPLDGENGLWGAIARYSMEGVTDEQRWSNDGYGLWFSTYELIQRSIPDTLDATWTYEIDSVEVLTDSITGDTTNWDDILLPRRDSASFENVSWRIDFGLDSLTLDIDSFIHQGIVTTQYLVVDSVPPFTFKDDEFEYNIVNRSVYLDVFSQDDFGLPDYSAWGWKWQGWIVSDHIYPDTAIGSFTPPPWDYKPGTSGNGFIPGADGGLLTTGKFSNIELPDDSDPYTYKIISRIIDTGSVTDTIFKRPDCPGEDFLNGAALNAAGITDGTALNLLPFPNGFTYGSVFLTLEPANDVLDSTNFPLIAFVREFPSDWPFGGSHVLMRNTTGTVPGTSGFPEITIKIERL
ncbi:MAG: anti-sigma factor [bacterium]|nr:anti-sigma factor [bacterium]